MPKVNHLIISLGGTGGRVMRAFRKRLFEEFRSIDPDPTQALTVLDSVRDEVFLQYLMVDSSSALIDSHNGWRVFGTSVKPLDANWLHLRQNINVPQWIRDSHTYPGIAQWIGDPKIWKDVPSSVVSGDAGGQRRRLGRLLFAANAERFSNAVTRLSGDLRHRSNQQSITFHLLCGLAGGTGSGAIVDAIAQIHKLSDHPDDKIVVYAVVPERQPKPNKNRGYYHANAYAALKELNAMLLGNYCPWDVDKGIKKTIDVTTGDKLRGIYLISSENSAQHQVYMDDDEDDSGGLSEIIGDFMFEKLVVDHLAQIRQAPIETAENVNDMPERIPNTDYALRSRRFLSFGIRRIAIPDEEITEYFALSFARQAINHLRYNHWTDAVGYIDSPAGMNYVEYVRDPARLQRWKITDYHLKYIAGISSQDLNRNWQPTIDEEWDVWMTENVNSIKGGDKHRWLDEIHVQFQYQFDKGYRGNGVGVRSFYDSRAVLARDIARTIRANVEQDLIEFWQAGALALADTVGIATALRRDVDDRYKAIVSQIDGLRKASEEAAREAQLLRDRWGRSLLQRTLFKNANFERMKGVCRAEFIANTNLAAADFAGNLGQRLVTDLIDLETSIQKAVQHLHRAVEEVQKRADARLQQHNPGSSSEYILRLVDTETVKRTINNRFVLDRAVQERQTQIVRGALIGETALGVQPTFAKIVEQWLNGDLIAKIEATCEQNARQAHDVMNLGENERVLGVSILRKLRNEYSGRPNDLAQFIQEIVQSAHALLRFDAAQVQMAADELGIDAQAPLEPPRAVVVHLPTGEDMPEFVGQIGVLIAQNIADAAPSIVPRTDKQNEITIVSTVTSFPARYLELCRVLKDEYERLLSDEAQSPRARLEMHTADECVDLPDIFAEIGPPRDAAAYLMLGLAFDCIAQRKNPTTGVDEVILEYKTPGGDRAQLTLANNIAGVLDGMRGNTAFTVRRELELRLNGLVHEDQKNVLRQKMSDQLREVAKTVRDDLNHPTYLAKLQAKARADELIAAGGFPGGATYRSARG